MAVKTTDTDPRFVSGRVREVLALESEIDKTLLQKLDSGRTTITIKATDLETVQLLVWRYNKHGWTVDVEDIGNCQYQLKFEDPEQLELTRKLKPVKV